MRLFPVIVFLTLVGSFLPANAAPVVGAPKPGLPSERDARAVPPSPEKTDTIQWTPPAGPVGDGEPVAWPAERRPRSPWTIEVHAGYLDGQTLRTEGVKSAPFAGAMLIWDEAPDRAWDIQIDVTRENVLRFGGARRFETPWTSRFEPYWKAGLTQTLDAGGMLAGFVDLERLKAIAAFGARDLFEMDRQWTAEVSAGVGMGGAAVSAQIGWCWNW